MKRNNNDFTTIAVRRSTKRIFDQQKMPYEPYWAYFERVYNPKRRSR